MKFCVKCGKENEGNLKFCVGCGASYENNVADNSVPASPAQQDSVQPLAPAQAPPQVPAPQAPAPQAMYPVQTVQTAQTAPAVQGGGLMQDAITAIMQTLSKDPERAVTTAINSRYNVWIALCAINAFIAALYMRVLVNGIINSIADMFGVFGGIGTAVVRAEINSLLNQIFIYTFIANVLSLIVLGLLVMALFSIFKIGVTFTKSMDIATSAALITSAVIVAAIVISFISSGGAFMLVLFSPIPGVIMLYRGIKKYANFPNSPLWVFMAFYVVWFFASYLIFNFAMDSALPDIPGADELMSGLFRGLF